MNFSDSGFQEVCKKTELSTNKNNVSIQDADENIEKEVETSMELSDMIEFSSDSGDEDGTYYMTTVWDISDIETRSPSVITSSPPYNGEVSGMVSDNIEILEENNNDPNNNLDFNEIPQESNGSRNIDEISKDRTDYSRELRSPIPGCSKDINNMENSTENSIYHKLRKDATLISTLLPDIEFGLILETLKKNQYAKNYCELALWDLLPDKRPMPQVSSKRKLTDDICEIEQKRCMSKELDIVPNEVQTNIEMTKALCAVSSKEKENFNIKESINSKVEEKKLNDAESKSISSISHSSIIRPAKLIVPKCVPPLQSLFIPSTNNVVLAPAKLTYVSKYEMKVTSNDKSLSPVKNLIPTQSTSKINENISRTNTFPDIKETQNCLLAESETCLKSLKNTNEVNADNSSDQVTSSVIFPIIKDTITSEDNKVLISSPDISKRSTEFVPSSNNDLNVPSTSGITISKRADIAMSTLNKFKEKSLNILTAANITAETSNLEVTEMEKPSFCESSSVTEIQDIKDSKLSPEMTRIYYKLLSIFPGVNSDYIKSICTFNDSQETDESILLHELIEHLLVSGDKYPHVNLESETSEAICDVNEQYENMLGIFPDADPIYLRDIVTNIHNKPEELKAFVQSKLETRDYPTREQYLAKRKITEQQKQYTTDFRIDKFLEIYPCPFTHFEDPKRQCSFNLIAFEFLKYYYNKLKTSTILLVYGHNKHHLTLTAKELDKIKPEMKTKRKSLYLPPKDIPLLQEFTFIQHRSEILAYLEKLQQEETIEFQRLKKSNGLLECQCCFDDECMPSKCSSCDNGHIFCNTCIIKGAELKLAESETHIHCFVNCTSEFSLSTLQKVLSPTTFSILLRKRQEAEVMAAGLEGLISCPFCHFASIPPPEDKVFKCFNPDCMKESCRLCKQLNHVPLNCDEVDSEKAHHYLEEKMTEALIHKCYKCSRPFFKEEGCNKMVCVCGAEMCYICDKPVNGYKHFRGQGSTQTDLCPLWSDNHVINAKAVLQIAQETEREIRQKNPNIKLVTNGLLPKIPHRRKGPHDDIPNSDVVPKRAHRIAIARMIPENLYD
ncbi:E3 ubiquitin-protein ligase RNF216-like isoform X2 [Vespula maculifrons]|uniref:E3 ubiquitin-protein ligase RNF216-like isoform X2 n=1 Tax=Vespula maculifrons TaxID=7453 RepID=A0ABD2B6X2_VESMC